MTKGGSIILRIYFGVVSVVTLITLMWGAIDFLTIGLKTYAFPRADVPSYGLMNCDSQDAKYQYGTRLAPTKADPGAMENLTPEEIKKRCEASNATALENYKIEKANNAVRNLALIIVSLPLFILHFRIVYRDWKDEKQQAKQS